MMQHFLFASLVTIISAEDIEGFNYTSTVDYKGFDNTSTVDYEGLDSTSPVDYGEFVYTSNTSTVEDDQIQPKDHPACGKQLHPLNLSPDKILKREDVWGNGRNYLILIPSYDTFVGFVVDLFFTKPVNGFPGLYSDVKATKFTPTHWALSKDYTQSACIKLSRIFFTISFEEESDIEALLFNGKPLIGQGKSLAVFQNKNINNAIDASCDKYFETVSFWFGGEKAKSINFSAKIQSDEEQLGVVVEFIFEKNIKEIRIWRLTAQMITGNHWKIYNSGFTVPPNGFVEFNFIASHYDHFHVKVKGVKLNGKVLCGLGSEVHLDSDDKLFAHMEIIEKNIKALTDFYNLLQITVIFVSLSMVISIGVLSSLLIKKRFLNHKQKKHLFDFPPRELPKQMSKDDSSETYIYSDVNNVTHM